MGRKHSEHGKRLLFYFTCCLLAFPLIKGCISTKDYQRQIQANKHLDQAMELMNQGYCLQAVNEQRKALKMLPQKPPKDKALYQLGLMMIDPRNQEQDYENALKIFNQFSLEFFQSEYREEVGTWTAVLSAFLKAQEHLKKNEIKVKELQKQIRFNEQLIDTLKDQRKKMKEIDLKLNKKREKTSTGEE